MPFRDLDERSCRVRRARGAQGARAASPLLRPSDCPLEAMREVHLRQRQVCIDMETLASTEVARPALAVGILSALCRDLPPHHADEDEDLFPLLRLRAREEDEIDRLLERLSGDHDCEAAALPPLLAALACMADGALPAPEDRTALRALAGAERRHMTIENAIVLPLARIRLTDRDRGALLAAMTARRASPFTAEGPCGRVCAGPRAQAVIRTPS